MKYEDIVEFKNKESKGKYSHNGRYIIINTDVRMKNSSTGEWIDAIAYSNSLLGSTVFVREKNDFINKFKIVED